MKPSFPLLLAALACTTAFGADAGATRVVRHIDPDTGVVWDAPGTEPDHLPARLNLRRAEKQQWEINRQTASSRLVDQRVSDPYLPGAEIRIRTLDPHGGSPRTRVDQAFTVDIEMSGLLTEGEFPESASRVRLSRQLSPADSTVQEHRFQSALIESNGRTSLRFEASALTAADPTKASGTETFAVQLLGDGGRSGPRIATASVEVLPIASGEIRGIAPDQEFTRRAPKVELVLKDLYPKSETELLLFEGTGIHGKPATVLKRLVIDREDPYSTTLALADFSALMAKNGTYTLVLASTTLYGREQLCPPVSFRITRPQRPVILPATAALDMAAKHP